MKYFLGEAATYSAKSTFRQLFVRGSRQDSAKLRKYLASHYSTPESRVALYPNGRSALAAGIRALVPKNSQIIVNGFTCQAVIEAVKAAKCTPIYADINPETLHFDDQILAKTLTKHPHAKAIIVQNTLGIPVDASSPATKVPPTSTRLPRLFSFAKRHNLLVIEDLAHSAGRFYQSGTECGQLGAATILSFGKGKAIDTISGGALILRSDAAAPPPQPAKAPKLADSLRARLYPLFGAIIRALIPSPLYKVFLAALLRLHLIERSADARLDTTRRLAHWQAKLALEQLQRLEHDKTAHSAPLRRFYLVDDRPATLAELRQSHYYFDETWYDCPISPQRNYAKWNFPEADCPTAVKISQHIINLPTHYPAKDLKTAEKIIKKHQIKEATK